MKAEYIDPVLLTADDAFGFRQTAPLLALYAALLWIASSASGPILLSVAILIGLTQYRLYFPLHEASHFHLFRSRMANRAVGRLLAGLLFTPFSAFRREHVQHHGRLGSREDPGASDYNVDFSSRWGLTCFLLLPLAGGTIPAKVRGLFFARHASGTPKDWIDIAITAGIQLTLFLVVGKFGLAWWRYPVLVVLPFITLFLFLSRLRMFLEHAPLTSGGAASDATAISRTVSETGWDAMLLSGCNFRYHHEHHLFPQIPGVNLPHLFRTLSENYRGQPAESSSYIKLLHDYWRRLA